jgi:hypothetical protein
MQPSALLKTQVALATISRLLALIAAPRDSGAITVLGTQGFNQPDGRRAVKVQKFKNSKVQRLHHRGFTTEPPLTTEPQGSKQSVNGQSDKWDAPTR